MKKPTKKQVSENDKAEARATLLTLLPKGTTVYTCLRKLAPSGMSRRMTLHVIDGQEKPHLRDITVLVARTLGYKVNGAHEVTVGGAGMDMGGHLVNNLSYALYGMNDFEAIGFEKSGYSFLHKWV